MKLIKFLVLLSFLSFSILYGNTTISSSPVSSANFTVIPLGVSTCEAKTLSEQALYPQTLDAAESTCAYYGLVVPTGFAFVKCTRLTTYKSEDDYCDASYLRYKQWSSLTLEYKCGKLDSSCSSGQVVNQSTCQCITPCVNPVPPIGFNKIADYNTFAECSASIPELIGLGYEHVSCITDCPDPLGNEGMSHAVSDTQLSCTPPKIMSTVVVGGTPVNSCITPIPPVCTPPLIVNPINNQCEHLAKNDPLSPNYNPFDTSACGQISESPLNAFGAVGVYTFSQYVFQGQIPSSQCQAYLLDSNIDSILVQPDAASECTGEYCFIHKRQISCDFDINSYKPAADFVYIYAYGASACSALVDGKNYISFQYKIPDSTNCPNTGYCFLQKAPNAPITPDSNTVNPDLNSTTPELSPLLQSQNNSNEKLDDIKNRMDMTNKSLDSLSTDTHDLLALNHDLKSSLDNFSLESGTFQDNSLGEQKTTNSKLEAMNKNLDSLGKNLSSIDSSAAKTAASTSTISDALYADVGLNPDGSFKDGSEGFVGYQDTLKGSFAGFVQTNMFTFANQSYSIPTISFTIYNHTFVLLDTHTLSFLDIQAFRSMLLFFFALAGFITVFKTI